MGTSSSYKGSSAKLPRALREEFTGWADAPDRENQQPLSTELVGSSLNIATFPRISHAPGVGGGGGGGGAGAAGGGSGGSRSRSGSGPQRNARSYALTAGRAAALARALRTGDRAQFEREGLDFDRLSSLSNRAEMVRAIVDAVCDAQTSSDIPSEEQRAIAGKLVDWTLDEATNPEAPSAADTAQYAVGLIAAEIFLSEMGDELHGRNGRSRDSFIAEIYETAQRAAARADIKATGASAAGITTAIEKGVRTLRKIYKPGAAT